MNTTNTVIYYHTGLEADVDHIESLENRKHLLAKEFPDINWIVAKSTKELMHNLNESNEPTTLVVFCIGYCLMHNISIEDKVNTILNAQEYCKTKIRIALLIYSPMEKLFIKQLKQLGINGIVPSITHFGIANAKPIWKQLFAGEESWPDECIKEDTIHIVRKKATNKIVLTNRQEDVFKLICHRGLSNKKIAQTLNISESTVKVHMSAILKAYGVRNRTQLALAGGSGLTA